MFGVTFGVMLSVMFGVEFVFWGGDGMVKFIIDRIVLRVVAEQVPADNV